MMLQAARSQVLIRPRVEGVNLVQGVNHSGHSAFNTGQVLLTNALTIKGFRQI
jgi:hypothetical protein